MNKIYTKNVETNEMYETADLYSFSRNLIIRKRPFTIFTNNVAMGKVLDVLVGASKITTKGFTGFILKQDLIRLSGISRSGVDNIVWFLLRIGVIEGIHVGKVKFYRWVKEHKVAKDISQLYDTLLSIDIEKYSKNR